MAANFRIIFLCVAFVLIPNFIKPPGVAAAEADFKLGFCPPVFLLDLVKMKDNAVQWGLETMDGPNKGTLECVNSLSGFFQAITIQCETNAANKPDKRSCNAEGWMLDYLDYEFAHIFIIVLLIAIGYGLVGSIIGAVILKILYYFRT